MIQKTWQWACDEKRAPWFLYGGLAFLILLPLLLPGYILTLDLVFAPNFPWPKDLTNTYPLEVLLWLIHFALPGDVIEKILLLIILSLSGLGMHQLVRHLKPKELEVDTWRIAAYFAGIFYMINPFTYSRFMAGQWLVLAGYALLPFFLAALLRLAARPTWRLGMWAALWGFATITFSLHHIGMLILLGGMITIAGVVRWRGDNASLMRFVGSMALSMLIIGVLSSFWLIPTLLGKGGVGRAVGDFNTADFTAFATNTHGALGAMGEVIRLQGFWPEARQLYLLPQAVVPLWGLLFLLVWTVVIIGSVRLWRYSRMLTCLTLGSILLGIVLAVTPVISWMSQVLPLFSGYREPHKFVNLIALGYAVLGGAGAAYLVRWAQGRFHETGAQVTTIVCLCLPLIITPVMLWGFAGQLSPRQYPSEWYEMNEMLKRTDEQAEVLFLPWHQYMRYSFSGRIIASPAEKFFESSVIVSDDPEFKGVSSTIPDAKKRAIAEALQEHENVAHTLREQNVRYILLAKEDDYKKYSYLDESSDIRLMQENSMMRLYKVEGEKQ